MKHFILQIHTPIDITLLINGTLLSHFTNAQHLMAVPMVLIVDGTSPGLIHRGTQWIHSAVQGEWIPEVLYSVLCQSGIIGFLIMLSDVK